MIILGIETSCDETSIALIEVGVHRENITEITVLAHMTHSQIEVHAQYGGVFPALAKREHAKNLIPIFKKILETANISHSTTHTSDKKVYDISYTLEESKKILEREPELLRQFLEFIPHIEKPPIDAIAVTAGPGLEPALWVGINFAKALSHVWDIPLVPVNHMEGHIFSALLHREDMIQDSGFKIQEQSISHAKSQILNTKYQILYTTYPSLALLVSGGHTEIVLLKNGFQYEIIGHTLDDAIGEAFDKVARILNLPYPGGLEIARLASAARREKLAGHWKFPRPMIKDPSLNMSYSGLKTAVLYAVKKHGAMSGDDKKTLAREFEDAALDVIMEKTKKAVELTGAKTLLVGGGVIANKELRRRLGEFEKSLDSLTLMIAPEEVATDNALMIAVAGAFRFRTEGGTRTRKTITALGNWRIDSI